MNYKISKYKTITILSLCLLASCLINSATLFYTSAQTSDKSIHVITENQATDNLNWASLIIPPTRYGRSFNFIGDNSFLNSVTVNIGCTNNGGQDYLQAFLYNSNNGLPTGTALLSSDKITIASLVSSPYPYTAQEVTFEFSNNFLLTQGVVYCIAIRPANDNYPDSTDNVAIQTTTNADGQHIYGTYVPSSSSWSVTGTPLIFSLTGFLTTQLTVTYNSNTPSDIVNFSGTVPIDNNKYTDGQNVMVSLNTGNLAADNYYVIGWARTYNAVVPDFVFDTSALPVRIVPSSFSIGGDSVTLYAVWSPVNITVEFGTLIFRQYELEGGTINYDLNMPYMFEVNSTVTFSVAGLSANYSFMGWLQNGTMISSSQSYNYIVQDTDTYVITAIFYDPVAKMGLVIDDLDYALVLAVMGIVIAVVLFAVLWTCRRSERGDDE